jgi:5-methylthioadenosine/S-adenosylhomocysteine deaminase
VDSQPDSVIVARWVVPVEPDGAVLENHAVVVEGGRIREVLPEAEARQKYAGHAFEEFRRHTLIPGLVNAHTHSPMTLMRGIADDLPLMRWLHDYIWPLEAKWVNPEFVRDGTELAVAEMLRGGVTCFNDMYFFPESTSRVCATIGIRAVIGLIVLDFPTVWAATADAYLDKGMALHAAGSGSPLVTFALAPHAPYSVSDAPFSRVRALSEAHGLAVHLHLHETKAEVDRGQNEHGVRPFQRLDRLGLITSSLAAVHMTQLDAAEIARCAEVGLSVVHCPESNLKLSSGFCPVARLLEAGVNVALGTDGAASNNDLDMFGEMRSAALLAKAVAEEASVVPAHTALKMATLNGARALGLDRLIGSIVPGKSADLVAVRLDGLEQRPMFDPVSQLVYSAGRHLVSDVWIAGRRQLQQRRLLQVDETALVERISAWQQKLSASSHHTGEA